MPTGNDLGKKSTAKTLNSPAEKKGAKLIKPPDDGACLKSFPPQLLTDPHSLLERSYALA